MSFTLTSHSSLAPSTAPAARPARPVCAGVAGDAPVRVVAGVRAATSLRLVAPQRVQIHSAVVAAVAHRLRSSTGGGQLLQGAPDELRGLGRGAVASAARTASSAAATP